MSDARIKEAILAKLMNARQPLEERPLLDAVPGRRKDKIRVLRGLVANHEVSRSGRGLRGYPFLYHANAAALPVAKKTEAVPIEAVTGAAPAPMPAPAPTPTFPALSVPTETGPQPRPEGPEPAPTEVYFKQYKMPDGSILCLTREEFDAVVDVFRLLLKADEKTKKNSESDAA